eukprot:1028-Eustigmatos_ZCMA.PRE.1
MGRNVAQVRAAPIGRTNKALGLVVQAALVGLVGRGADHARGPALGLAPQVDRVARQAIDHEEEEEHRGR